MLLYEKGTIMYYTDIICLVDRIIRLQDGKVRIIRSTYKNMNAKTFITFFDLGKCYLRVGSPAVTS